MRYLILMHRYLGTAVGVLMLGWCLTGIVMMYVRYPALPQSQRLRQLQPLQWRDCCRIDTATLPPAGSLAGFQVENLGTRAVLQLQRNDGPPQLIDLIDGRAILTISPTQAREVAHAGVPQTPRLLGLIEYDEWTVSGEFNAERPLYLFALDDPSGTRIYISARSGRSVQITTTRQRFWNWIGAVPHWLYFTQLRHRPALWTQVVIGTSLAGCFLSLFGIYLGVRQFLRRPPGRWSGFRGLLYWHHVPGLIFGVFALTFVASGLISMNPWGFLDSTARYPGVEALLGPPTLATPVRDTLRNLAALPLPTGTVALYSSWLWGEPYLIAARRDGSRIRMNLDGSAAPLTASDWTRIARTLTGKLTRPPQLLTDGDEYYLSRPGVAAQLPVYRLILDDAEHTRFYLDPVTGAPLAALDSDGRWYRWLHRGLHTLDVSAVLRSRPLWDVVMIMLLLGVGAIAGTGTWLGWRHYLRTPGCKKRHED